MMTAPSHMLTQIKRIRVAAETARKTEAMAENAAGGVQLDLWIRFDEEVSSILGLILSPEGAAALDAIEARIGGKA